MMNIVKNKKFGIILLALLVLTNVVALIRIYNLKSIHNNLQNYYSKVVANDKSTIKLLANNLRLVSINSNFLIDTALTLISESNKSMSLSNIKIERYKFVFRFNEFTCMDCVHKEMGNIEELANKIGRENILILASYKRRRDLFMNKRVNNLKLPVFNVPLNSINNTIEKNNIPYMFIMDNSYRVHHLFIPDNYVPDLSDNYFQDVIKLFDENETNIDVTLN